MRRGDHGCEAKGRVRGVDAMESKYPFLRWGYDDSYHEQRGADAGVSVFSIVKEKGNLY